MPCYQPRDTCAGLQEGIVALRTSSVDALLPFPRLQQVQSECDPASKPCSPPDSPAHSAATSPFHRSAKGVARCFSARASKGEPSVSSDIEDDSGAECGAQPSQMRQLRGSCAGSCILLLPSSSVTSQQRPEPSGPSGLLPSSAARMHACQQLLEHAASAHVALDSPAEPQTSHLSSPQEPQLESACSAELQQHSAPSASHAVSAEQHSKTALKMTNDEEEREETPSLWADVPDDILRGVCEHMPPSYVRVVRLVCCGWAAAAGRLMQRLKPEALEGPRLAQRFPHLRALDLSHCLHTVTFHTQCAPLPITTALRPPDPLFSLQLSNG